jgi:hypothetical protein
VETHSLKAAKTRAWANYDIMRHTIDTILPIPEALRKAVRDADKQMAARAGDRSAPAGLSRGQSEHEKSHPLVYLALEERTFPKRSHRLHGDSAISGELDDIQTVIHDQIDTTVEAQMPLGYLIPPRGKTVAGSCWRCTAWKWSAPPNRMTQEFETYRFSGDHWAGLAGRKAT